MFKIISLILLCCVSSLSFSFSAVGHKAIAAVAWSKLTPLAKQNVERILGGGEKRFIKASTWADRIKSYDRFDYLKPLHYVNMPKNVFVYDKKRDCRKNKCIVEAIKAFSKTIKSRKKKQQLLALRLLIHLIADIHQPLHAGLYSDRGGNRYKVRFNNKSLSLHQFWDTHLLRTIAKDWQGLASILQKSSMKVSLLGPEQWAQESHQLSMTHVYKAKKKAAISQAYIEPSQDLIKKQMYQAGWRLAAWLNKLW